MVENLFNVNCHNELQGMKNKVIGMASFIALGMSSLSLAEEKNTELKLNKITSSPFSLNTEFKNDTSLNINKNEGSLLETDFEYKLSGKNILNSGVLLSFTQREGEEGLDRFETNLSSAYMGYQRKGILVDEKNGFDLDFQTRLYKYGKISNVGPSDLGLQFRIDAGKVFSDRLSFNSFAYYEGFIKTEDEGLEGIVHFEGGPTLKVNKNLSLTSTFTFHYEDKYWATQGSEERQIFVDPHSYHMSLSLRPDYKVNDKIVVGNEISFDKSFDNQKSPLHYYGVHMNPTISYSFDNQLRTSLGYKAKVLSYTNESSEYYNENWLKDGGVTLNLSYNI